MNVRDARIQLGDVVDRARYGNDPTLIIKHGRAYVVVVSVGWYRAAVAAIGGDPLPEE